MANYVSFNFKFYKHSNRNTLEHNNRIHRNIDNIKPELSRNNIHLGNNERRYDRKYDRVTKRKGKRIQKNANTFLDGVLAFSHAQVQEMKMKHGDNFKNEMAKSIKNFMMELKNEFGFEPVTFDFHADEGSYDDKTGEWKENYHAHIIMFNYDFKTGTAPLRKMTGKAGKYKTSLMQDLAGKAFAPHGFVRGVSKNITKKKHLERDDYITKKQEEKISKLIDTSEFIGNLLDKLNGIDKRIDNDIDNKISFVNKFAQPKQIERELIDIAEIFKKMDLDAKEKEKLQTIKSLLGDSLVQRISDLISGSLISMGLNPFENNDLHEKTKPLKNLQNKIKVIIDKSEPKI